MSDILSNKAVAIQAVVARLICALGPDRVMVGNDAGYDSQSVAVASRADPSRAVVISIAGMAEGRYSVTYDQLHTKRGGDASVAQTTASDVVFEGLFWIAQKILDDGVVTGEFERVPEEKRIRR